ncbi:MAG: hypothetical protein H6R26_1339, partial [Proteobacteria bacterium]|nr:hypothetical protein [Pseudomonadota bacterium]
SCPFHPFWLSCVLPPDSLNGLHHLQNYERNRAQGEQQEAIGKRDIGCLEKAAQSRVVLTPHLDAERGRHHEDKVAVREQRNAPDRLGFTACTEGPQEFGEDQDGKGVSAGRFRGFRSNDLQVSAGGVS